MISIQTDKVISDVKVLSDVELNEVAGGSQWYSISHWPTIWFALLWKGPLGFK